MPQHVVCRLPDGTRVVAGVQALIVPHMRRIHQRLAEHRDPAPADYQAVADWYAEHGEHVCPDDCDA